MKTSENRIRLRLRRRGSIGRPKESEIFTRDREAEEGRDYFCDKNASGLIRFGPTEIYKGQLSGFLLKIIISNRKFQTFLSESGQEV